ncbi:hypothetical protein BGZ83_001526, partial [Gryganskiella cystojenkinii]
SSSSIKLELQSMPPDHPPVENSATGVCPIVHGQAQRERLQQQQAQTQLQSRQAEMQESRPASVEEEIKAPCPWAKMSEQWKDRPAACPATGHTSMDTSSSERTKEDCPERSECDSEAMTTNRSESNGNHFDYENGSRSPSGSGGGRQSLSPGSSVGSHSQQQQQSRYGLDGLVGRHFSPPTSSSHGSNGDEQHRHHHRHHTASGAVNLFSTGPSSPTSEASSSLSSSSPYSRTGSSLRRTSSVGRSSFIGRNGNSGGGGGSMSNSHGNNSKGNMGIPVQCLSGACGSVCRCSNEDEETRAVRAMEAARKRMSVHSLLC